MKSYLWNSLTLLPQRAVWRENGRVLFVADMHIGKAATFRAAGVAAPAGTTRENLARLDALIDALEPRTLVVLGDLFHGAAAFRDASLTDFAAWRDRRARLQVRLVVGNHDARAGKPPAALGLDPVDEPFDLDGLTCRHHPPAPDGDDGPIVLCGHLHPAARIHGPAWDSLRLPCFIMRGRQLILPAFGEFTGSRLVAPDAESSLCIVAGDRLLHVAQREAAPASRHGSRPP